MYKWTYLGTTICEDDQWRACYIEQKHQKGYPRNWLHKPTWKDRIARAAKTWDDDVGVWVHGTVGPDMKFISNPNDHFRFTETK